MAEVLKPADINKIWSATGDILAPSDTKISQGWQVEIPPRQYFNYIDNKQDQAIAHINQHGIAVWDNTTEYQSGKSYVQGSDGKIYFALQTAANQNPVSAPTYWTPLVSNRFVKVTSNISFTVPLGVSTIYLSGCAAGGGGGGTLNIGATGNISAGAGGGGAGQAIIKQAFSVTPGQVINITIGTAGAGGAIATAGSPGGNTVVGSLITLTGGSGGGPGAGGVTSSNWAGGAGGVGFPAGSEGSDVISSYGAVGGAGGSGPFGGGGGARRGALNTSLQGLPAAGFGAGGSGAGGAYGGTTTSSGNTGGAGAPGMLIIEW